MKLIEVILRDENLEEAIRRVKSNKGVPGIDKMTVNEIDAYFKTHKEQIKKQILEKKCRNHKGYGIFSSVPSMALILLVKVQSRVFTAKCSEPQVGTSNGMDEGRKKRLFKPLFLHS